MFEATCLLRFLGRKLYKNWAGLEGTNGEVLQPIKSHNGSNNVSLRSWTSPGHGAFLDQVNTAPVTFIASVFYHLTAHLFTHSKNTDGMYIVHGIEWYVLEEGKNNKNIIWYSAQDKFMNIADWLTTSSWRGGFQA